MPKRTKTISFYDLKSEFVRSHEPNPIIHQDYVQILDFAYSLAEQRIGAILIDNTIAFWDLVVQRGQKREYEKTINISRPHSKIFYIEFNQTWVTMDDLFNLNEWDILEQTSVRYGSKPVHTNILTDVVELPQYEMIATSSLDKRIVMWEVTKRIARQIINVPFMSVQQIVYTPDFRSLFTINTTNEIQIYTFDNESCFNVGVLDGHTSEVTAICALKGTSLLLSIDEFKFIKTWDIRDF